MSSYEEVKMRIIEKFAGALDYEHETVVILQDEMHIKMVDTAALKA